MLWVVVLVVPMLMYMFAKTETYYTRVGRVLRIGLTPKPPRRRASIVIVPIATVSVLAERAMSAALSLGETVVAVAVAGDEDEAARIRQMWEQWKCSAPIEILIDPHRSLVRSVLAYVESIKDADALVTVLIPEVIPSKRRHELLHNQRGRILEAVLKSRTGVVVATLPLHIHE